MGQIKELLLEIGAISEPDLVVFSEGTRDRDSLIVYRDRRSGVIFIDNFYVGHEEYEVGEHRDHLTKLIGIPDWERYNDTKRRTDAYKQFIVGKDIVDVGCGKGHFVENVQYDTKSVLGVEIDSACRKNLDEKGISNSADIGHLPDDSIDTVFCFHVLEHLIEPMKILSEMRRVLRPGGVIIIEVPHARDFLLTTLGGDAYKLFALWSQHLILHTRSSLERLIAEAGFTSQQTEGIQRYPLSNHLHWLKVQKPGGHKSLLSCIDSPALVREYGAALSKLDATDTLVCIAEG